MPAIEEDTKQAGLVEAAAGYAARGWAVFPCRTKTKFPNGALAPQGVRNASADPATLAAWWTRSPHSNIGLACGPISGVAVVDIDVDAEKGIDGFRSLREMGVELPETVQQISPRGGAHYIYAITGEPPANKNSFRPGIDIRCDGYYILLAPSIHPNGKAYAWAPGHAPGEIELAPFPDFMRPEAEKKPAAPPPWLTKARPEAPPAEQPAMQAPAPEAAAPKKPVAAPGGAPIHERARLYLQSCDAAIQGLAGHDKLLWAATAMVHGFLLSDQDALQLLASEYNPRCVPPWNLDEATDRKDFERKVSQARGSRHTKPAGWLLDEYGLREPGGNAEGAAMQRALLAGMPPAQQALLSTAPIDHDCGWRPFPLEVFPEPVREFAQIVAVAHSVDPAIVALPILATAAAALGNAFRLRLKSGFDVPPVIWAIFVARTGSNKSGPLGAILEPMREPPPPTAEFSLLSPAQPQDVLRDTTSEAVLPLLRDAPRGMLLDGEEMGQFFDSFDAYRKGKGGDEQKWIAFWDARHYTHNRKTNGEHIELRSPAVCIAGAVQPEILSKAVDPDNIASGFFPRALLAMPKGQRRRWSSEGVGESYAAFWRDTVNAMRTRPFAELDTATGTYMPNIIEPDPGAMAAWVDFYELIADRLEDAPGIERAITAKYDVHAARLALVLHGLHCATGQAEWGDRLPERTMRAATRLAGWFLDESLRVFAHTCQAAQDQARQHLLGLIKKKGKKQVTVNEMQRSANRYNCAGGADMLRDRFTDLASAGLGTFDGTTFTLAT